MSLQSHMINLEANHMNFVFKKKKKKGHMKVKARMIFFFFFFEAPGWRETMARGSLTYFLVANKN